MSPEVSLEGRDLLCERDDRVLFEKLDVGVSSGQLLQVEGRNGAGKTTLLRILAGLMWPQDGQVLWRGQPLSRVREQFAADIIYLGHRTGIKTSLTPLENLHFWARLRGEVDETVLREALWRVGLKGFDTVPCGQLSAGQQRRAALARLFVSPARLWILDEAFTAIDKRGVQELETWLLDKVDAGGAIILTTHHALNLGDRVRCLNLDRAS